MTDIQSKSVAIGVGRSISYLECGEGAPMIFLHGIGSGARSWRSLFQSLSGCGLRLIAWDAPGYGISTAVEGEKPLPAAYAAALAEFAAALRIDRFHLVGHSLGSLIATTFARAHPDRLRSLTLASIAPGQAHLPQDERARLRDGRLKTLAEMGVEGMARARGPALLSADASEDMRRSVIETMAALRPDGFRQAVYMLSQGDTRSVLAEVSPALAVQIVFGDADTVTPPESNRRTAGARPLAPINVIAGAGHAVYIEKTAEFAKVLRDFVAAHG